MDVIVFIRNLNLVPDDIYKLYQQLKNLQGYNYAKQLVETLDCNGQYNPTTYRRDAVHLFLQHNLPNPEGRQKVMELFDYCKMPTYFVDKVHRYQPPHTSQAPHTSPGTGFEQADMENMLREATKEVNANIEVAQAEKTQLERKIKEMKEEYAQMVQFADPYAKQSEYKKKLDPEFVVSMFKDLKKDTRKQGNPSPVEIFKKCHEAAEKYKQKKLADAEQAMKDVLEQHLGPAAVREGVKTSTSLETTLLKELNLQDLRPYVTEIKDSLQRERLGSATDKYLELAWRIVLQRPEMKLVWETHSRTELFEPDHGRVMWPALLVEGGETVLGVCG